MLQEEEKSKPTGYLIANLFCFNCLASYWKERLTKVYVNLDAFQEISCPNCSAILWRLDVQVELTTDTQLHESTSKRGLDCV